MKKQIISLAIILFAVPVLFNSCQKECLPPPPPIEEEEETFTSPDEIQDLVGYFSSIQEIFLVDPQYLESVLEFVGATPTTDGRFHVIYVNDEGAVKEYFFWVQLISAPQLFEVMNKLQESEPILEDEDKDGKWKLYKHAICPEKVNVKAESSDCETVANDPGGAKSRKTDNGAYKKCIYNENENNLCRMVMGKIGTTTYYEKLKCQGKKIRTEDYNAMRCGL